MCFINLLQNQGKIFSKYPVINKFKAFLKSWWPTDRLCHSFESSCWGKKDLVKTFWDQNQVKSLDLNGKTTKISTLWVSFSGQFSNITDTLAKVEQLICFTRLFKRDNFLPDSIALLPCQDVNRGPLPYDNSKILALTSITTFFARGIQVLSKGSKIQPSSAPHWNGIIYILCVHQPMACEQKK